MLRTDFGEEDKNPGKEEGRRKEGRGPEEKVRGWEKWWSVGRGNEGGRRMGREEKEERRAGGDTRKREREGRKREKVRLGGE